MINGPKKKFLLVDDDADDALLFQEALSNLEPLPKFETVENGQEVFDVLSKHQIEKPDIIFLDINMPIMNGWDCLRKLKEDSGYRHIPVIMYSTSSAKHDVDMAYKLGALTFLTKPEDFNELSTILQVVAKTPQDTLLMRLSKFQSIKTRGCV